MKWVIDRFEEDNAVLLHMDTMEPEDFLRKDMPKGARPGHTVYLQDGRWSIDYEDSAARSKKVKSLFEQIKKANGYS
jgi:hypothetical protein